MNLTRRNAIGVLAGALPAARIALGQTPSGLAIAKGPFQGTRESLKGISRSGLVPRRQVRHLGALGAAVGPEQGDWYARNMYIEGDLNTSGTNWGKLNRSRP